jgi:hypothetical protein
VLLDIGFASLLMAGKAKSKARKSRDKSTAKELLIQQAVKLYEEANSGSRSGQTQLGSGYRAAAKEVQEKNYIETGEFIVVDHNTVRHRHLALRRSHTEAHFDYAHLSVEKV